MTSIFLGFNLKIAGILVGNYQPPLHIYDYPTSVGTILHLAGIPFAQLMSEMISEAFARHSTKSPLVNKSA